MVSKLIVDENNKLRKVENNDRYSSILRTAATIISYIFHPVFIPVYVMVFLLYIEPFLFVGFDTKGKSLVLVQSILMFTFFPLVSVGLLKALNFIGSIKLNERKDRIIPFIICNIWYFWIWYVWRNLPEIPREAVVFAMSIFLASSIGLLFNNYIKISLHAIAIGTAISFLCLLAFQYNISFGIYLSIAAIAGGAVCTARLILNDHIPAEIYWGLATGLLAVLLANIFM
ncbi:MAG: hypothetical protein ACK5NK_08840 [Niabella sp.]